MSNLRLVSRLLFVLRLSTLGVATLFVWRALKLPHKIWRAQKRVQKSLAGKIYPFKTQNRASLNKKHTSKHDN